MSLDNATKNICSSQDELPTRNTTNTQAFLQTCALHADHKAMEEHLVNNLVQQSDLDRCLLRLLELVQWKEKELSHVVPTLTLLLQYGAKWNGDVLLGRQQATPYHIICESPGDHHELLDLMIKSSQGTIIDTQDTFKRTALLYAVQNANINCLKCLITNGADANIGCDSSLYRCPITVAIQKLGHGYKHTSVNVYTDIFNLLLDSGVKVNRSFNRFSKDNYRQSPIMSAVCLRNVYCIKKLIMNGARLNTTDCYDRYVWSLIAKLGNVQLLKYMFNHGIDKDSTDKNGVSILWHVVDSGNVEAVRYLLDLGVFIPSYAKDVRKTKCMQCKYSALVIDADHIWEIDQYLDPCLRAIYCDKLEIVKLLDEGGSQSCKCFNTLRRAVILCRMDVVYYLLNKYRYPLNMEYVEKLSQCKCMKGFTLLTDPHIAAHKGSDLFRVIKLLLDHGADPAMAMCSSTSANGFMTAIHYGQWGVLAQYIRSGVNINCRSYHCELGRVLPFEASILHGYKNIAEMLIISGCSCGVYSIADNDIFMNYLRAPLDKLMKDWNVQENNVKPPQQRCRSVILNHLSPQADMKIKKLPLPGLLIKFLNFPELDHIKDRYRAETRHL